MQTKLSSHEDYMNKHYKGTEQDRWLMDTLLNEAVRWWMVSDQSPESVNELERFELIQPYYKLCKRNGWEKLGACLAMWAAGLTPSDFSDMPKQDQ